MGRFMKRGHDGNCHILKGFAAHMHRDPFPAFCRLLSASPKRAHFSDKTTQENKGLSVLNDFVFQGKAGGRQQKGPRGGSLYKWFRHGKQVRGGRQADWTRMTSYGSYPRDQLASVF